jgi:serine protease
VALAAGAAALWLAHHGRDAIIEEFGAPEYVASAFRSAVRATVQNAEGWNPNYGAGILDVEALLRCPLDAVPRPADPLAPVPKPAERAVRSAESLLPELGAESAASWVSTLFESEQDLALYGGEVVHRLAHEAAVAPGPGAASAELSGSADDPQTALTRRLAENSSPELRAALRAS